MGGESTESVSTSPIAARGLPTGLSAPSDLVMWMPGGTHAIRASKQGQPIEVRVQVDRSTAATMQQVLRQHIHASRQRPYLDFNHSGAEAAAWPVEFIWLDTPEPGVYARVEWSEAGRAAVTGKTYRAFSPTFFVDSNDPARVTGSPLNMGGLVNEPAFRQIAPLWAREGRSMETDPNKNETGKAGGTTPNATSTAATQGNPGAREVVVLEVQDRGETLKAKEAALAEATTQITALQTELRAIRKEQAQAAVEAAVARGAIPPKDEAIQAKWREQIERDPSAATLLSLIPGNPILASERITTSKPTQQQQQAVQGSQVSITREATVMVLKAYDAEKDPHARAVIYAREIRARLKTGEADQFPIEAANTLGTLAADIVSQRALDLLVEQFPVLTRISTNFSDEGIKFGRTVNTRIITPPSTGDYDVNTGYPRHNARADDVPVTIDQHKSCEIAFNANELSGTTRSLFREHAPGQAYALGSVMVSAVYGLILAANYAERTVSTLANFDRATVITMGTELTTRKAPPLNRTLLLTPTYHGKLFSDPAIVSLASYNRPEVITQGKLPPVHGFEPFEAVSLPSAEYLRGFGFTPDAMCMAARLPMEYASALPGVSGGGVVSVIVEPNTGLSVQQVAYVDHKMGTAAVRLAIQYGVAKGQVASGQRLVSQAS